MIPPASTGWTRFVEVATARPAAPALVSAAGVTRFADLRDEASRRALLYAERLRPGARAIVWSENSAAMAAAILALWSIGAIPVLLGRETSARHVRHAADVTGAGLVIAESALLDRAAALVGCDVLCIDEQRDRSPNIASRGRQWSDPGSIVMTSGSTGLPKAVVQTHGTLRTGQALVARSLGLRADDVILCASPWSFDFGWGQLLNTLLMGTTQVLAVGRYPLAMVAAIEAYRPSVLAVTASAMAGLTHGVSDIARHDMTSLHMVTTSGARVAKGVLEEWHRRVPRAAISLNYGLTETYRSTSLPPSLALTHPGSVGTPIPGVGIAIVDSSGDLVSAGQTGEVVHCGGGVFAGYWGDRAETERVRRPAPGAAFGDPPAVYTGDLGYVDDCGRLHLVGRRDRQVKAMGVRICPEEIEQFILETGLVREVAVTAIPFGVYGDALLATIVGGDGESDDLVRRLKEACRIELSATMRPRRVEIVDRLPRTISGKIDYVELQRRSAGTSGNGAVARNAGIV